MAMTCCAIYVMAFIQPEYFCKATRMAEDHRCKRYAQFLSLIHQKLLKFWQMSVVSWRGSSAFNVFDCIHDQTHAEASADIAQASVRSLSIWCHFYLLHFALSVMRGEKAHKAAKAADTQRPMAPARLVSDTPAAMPKPAPVFPVCNPNPRTLLHIYVRGSGEKGNAMPFIDRGPE